MTAAGEPNITQILGGWGIPALIGGVVVLLMAMPTIVSGLGALVRTIVLVARLLSPTVFSPSARAELDARHRIANLLLSNLDLLEAELYWDRNAFTEIRVTVETVDGGSEAGFRFGGRGRTRAAYRTAPLVKTLQRDKSMLVSLQGQPGSGKSVALRQYGRGLLVEARRRRLRPGPIALYVNLRDLNVAPEAITVPSLREYISRQANPRESPELATYLRDGLDRDIRRGEVVILFDSFDEIPAVLGSANIDRAVLPYVEAISSLMAGGKARGVVASREYRGPRVPGWTRIQLVGMSYDEQIVLLRSYGVDRRRINDVSKLLLDPHAGFSNDLRNPLYLSLLARFLLAQGRMPTRTSELLENYVVEQLAEEDPDDRDMLLKTLMSFAFELTDDSDTGLSAAASVLRSHLVKVSPSLDNPDNNSEALHISDRLIASKLLIEIPATSRRPRRVAFVHRRVQEYFATRYVISHPAVILPEELVKRGRWRETTVAMLQVGSQSETLPLLAELEGILRRELDREEEASRSGEGFTWGPSAFHVLELLYSAYGSDARAMPPPLADIVDGLVGKAWNEGRIDDRKFALDCIPLIKPERQEGVVTSAFTGSSEWLRLSALRNCSALHPLPGGINEAIRRLLITLMGAAQLRHNAPGLDADLGRLYHGSIYRRLRRLLAVTPFIVVLLCCVHVAIQFTLGGFYTGDVADIRIEILYWMVFPLTLFWAFQSSLPLAYPSLSSRMRRFSNGVLRLWNMGSATKDSDFFWFILVFIAVIQLGLDFAFLGLKASEGQFWASAFYLTVRPITDIFPLLWGPAVLRAVRLGEDGEGLPIVKTLLLPPMAVRNFVISYRRLVPRLLLIWLGSLVPVAIMLALIQGIFYVLIHFGGHAGHAVSLAMDVLLLGIAPLVVVLQAFSQGMSRRRVRRRLAQGHELGPQEFLNSLRGLAEPLEAAEYVRLLRIQQTARARDLPLAFIRRLAAQMESVANSSGCREQSEPLPPFLPEGLTSEQAARWCAEVLDEIGRMAEFLRER